MTSCTFHGEVILGIIQTHPLVPLTGFAQNLSIRRVISAVIGSLRSGELAFPAAPSANSW